MSYFWNLCCCQRTFNQQQDRKNTLKNFTLEKTKSRKEQKKLKKWFFNEDELAEFNHSDEEKESNDSQKC